MAIFSSGSPVQLQHFEDIVSADLALLEKQQKVLNHFLGRIYVFCTFLEFSKDLERSIAQRKKLFAAVQEEKGQDQVSSLSNLKSRSRERINSVKPERLPRRRNTLDRNKSIKADPVAAAAINRKRLDSDWLELLALKMSTKDTPEIFLEQYPAASHFGHILMHDPATAVIIFS